MSSAITKAIQKKEALEKELNELNAWIKIYYSLENGEPSFQFPLTQSSITDALVKMAEENGGVVNTFKARKLFVENNYFKDEKTAAKNIYPRLSGSTLFKKGGKKGDYYLIMEEKDQLNGRN